MGMYTATSSVPPYRVAAIQYEATAGEKETNIQHLLALVEEAAAHQARIIVLPELAVTGSCWSSRAEVMPLAESIPGPTTERFQAVATRQQCWIVLSLPEIEVETQLLYNSVVLLGPEGLVGTYRKWHAAIGDPRWASIGDLPLPVWETPLGRLSPLIGVDAMCFETARLAALRGADILVLPAAWYEEKGPSNWWVARAFENGLYLIAANRAGYERGFYFGGGSCIINPDGTLQCNDQTGEAVTAGNAIIYGEINLQCARLKTWKQDEAIAGYPLADRRPDAYVSLLNNNYLWEPLRYHSLYDVAALPPGQLSCVGFVQMPLDMLAHRSPRDILLELQRFLLTEMQNNAPALPDIIILPELLFPGPVPPHKMPQMTDDEIRSYYQNGAITVPGPETEALIALAKQLQVSIVFGVAERGEHEQYYNTVLLIDPEGIYGTYRKLHLSPYDRLWATAGNYGLPAFDTPAGRIGLATGYDVLFPETLRVLAIQGVDLVCAPSLLAFPAPLQLVPSPPYRAPSLVPEEYGPSHALLWRIRSAENNVYLALANWSGSEGGLQANGQSGIFAPTHTTYPWPEVVAEDDETGLMMMTIDTREQRNGRRTSQILEYSPGEMLGSLTGELAYSPLDSIPGNVVRSKPLLRRRQPQWYKDLVRTKSSLF